MSVQWLVNWWNLIFLLPLGLALLYLGLYMVSGLTFGDAEVDHDFDADADGDMSGDADADADADHDFDADHDIDGDADGDIHEHSVESDSDGDSDGEQDSESPMHAAVLSWIGVGRVPASLVLMILMISWGVTGLFTNAAMKDREGLAAAVSIPLAAVVAILGTHFLSGLVGRAVPAIETSAHRRHALLGSIGEAILPIDRRFGMVSVREEGGDLFQVPCRVEADAEPIAKGATVKLVSYNAKYGLFCVTKYAADAPAASK